MNWLDPFHHDFMLVAFGMAALIGATCAVLSCFIVLKGWSLMGDAIAHAVLPGVVLAYAAGLPLTLGAFASGLVCAIGTGLIKAHSRVKEDTVMGVVFTGLFALGLVLFTKVESDQHLMHVLFGSLLGIPRPQILQAGAISLFTLSTMLLLRHDLLLFCFDPGHARAIGLPVKRLRYLLLSLLALTVVASIQAVGIILVVAMLITPGCIGFLLTSRFSHMMIWATVSAVFSGLTGVYLSYFGDASTSACVVLVQSSLFLLAFVFAPQRGLLAARLLRRKILADLPA